MTSSRQVTFSYRAYLLSLYSDFDTMGNILTESTLQRRLLSG